MSQQTINKNKLESNQQSAKETYGGAIKTYLLRNNIYQVI